VVRRGQHCEKHQRGGNVVVSSSRLAASQRPGEPFQSPLNEQGLACPPEQGNDVDYFYDLIYGGHRQHDGD
jgi:hypothetical protein